MAAPRGFNGTRMAQLAIETEHHRVVTIVPGLSGLRLNIGAGEGAGDGLELTDIVDMWGL
jgi:hypothetical protein